MKIAVDAMGGDLAPRDVVRGAVLAAREFNLRIVLVGVEEQVRAELKAAGSADERIEVVHAPDVVGMDDIPSVALRKKRESSIRVGLNLVSDGTAASFLSAGNTGAVMGGALLVLKKIRGVERPALGATIPTPTGPVLLIDAGANVGCKPAHLIQFGCMGETYARKILGIVRPRVGLLSIGEEETKGTDLTRETSGLFRKTGLSYVGNVEGRDFFADRADVFVCDGFVGNIVLKTMEGMATALGQFLKEEILKSPLAKVGAVLAGKAIQKVRNRLDYAEHGGAPLLGVRGGVVVCHGASDARAFMNAIREAGSMLTAGVEEEIARSIAGNGHEHVT
jgi:phosphate acyltransferase